MFRSLSRAAWPVDGKRLNVAGDVDRSPPHVLCRIRVLDDPLVLGRATRLHSGISNQHAVLGNAGVPLVANGVLVEGTRREVAVHFTNGQLVLFQVAVAFGFSISIRP